MSSKLRLFLLEGLLLYKNALTKVTIIFFLLFLILSIFMTYSLAIDSVSRVLDVYEKVKETVANHPEVVLRLTNLNIHTKNFWGLHPSMGSNLALAAITSFGHIFFAVLGAVSIGNEFSWKTNRVRAVHDGWLQVVMFKIAWIFLASIIVVVIFSFLGCVANYLTWPRILEKIEFLKKMISGFDIVKPEFAIFFWRQLIMVSLSLTLWGLLGAFVTIVTNSSQVGLFVGITYPLFEALMASRLNEQVLKWSFVTVYEKILSKEIYYVKGSFPSGPYSSGVDISTLLPPTIILIAYIIILTGLILFISTRQEVNQ